MSNKIVAVTGASGFIAGLIIDELFAKDCYIVRGTVRDLSNETKLAHLKAQWPDIQLFEADLLKENSFDACFEGADYVIHCASPFFLQAEDPQKELVDPAVNGTANVLSSVEKHSNTIKRVVVTSSCAAIADEGVPPEGKIWTEDDWNTTSTLTAGPYRLSKTLAEKKAWEFYERWQKESIPTTLATINPALVLGAPKSKRGDSTSVKIVSNILSGAFKDGVMPITLGCVSAIDVAKAHVAAMEKEEAKGNRFIVSSTKGYTFLELATFIKNSNDEQLKKYFDNLPTTVNGTLLRAPQYSHKKAVEVLGITFTPIEEVVVEMAKYIASNNMI